MSNRDREHIRLNEILPSLEEYFRNQGCRFDTVKVVHRGTDQDGRGIATIQAVPTDTDRSEDETCRLHVKTISERSCRVLCLATHTAARQFLCTYVGRQETKQLIGKEEVTRRKVASGLTQTCVRIVFCENLDVGPAGFLPGDRPPDADERST